MNRQNIEALGRLGFKESSRLPALSQAHHFPTVTRTTDSLFAYRDGIALLQQRVACSDS